MASELAQPRMERRRSERILQELLIEVTWRNLAGKDLSARTRTANVSRYGAKILLKQELAAGQEIGIYCLMTEKRGQARVVGLSERRGRVYFYGIEFLDHENNLWNIPFRLFFDALE